MAAVVSWLIDNSFSLCLEMKRFEYTYRRHHNCTLKPNIVIATKRGKNVVSTDKPWKLRPFSYRQGKTIIPSFVP